MKKKLSLKQDYLLTCVDNVIGSRNHFKGIKENDLAKVAISKYIYFGALMFFMTFSILSTVFFRIMTPDSRQKFNSWVALIEIITFFMLVGDYFLWWWTSSIRNKKQRPLPRIRFLFSWLSVSLFLSMVPSLYVIDLLFPDINISWVKLLASFKFLRLLRILMLLNLFHSFATLFGVFQKQKAILINVFVFIFILIILFSLIIMDAEMQYLRDKGILTADNEIADGYNWDDLNSYPIDFWRAFYFTTISLTTIGYGDVVPHAEVTRVLVMIMAIIGIAIFAIPSGVIASSFLSKVQDRIESGNNKGVLKKIFNNKKQDDGFEEKEEEENNEN